MSNNIPALRNLLCPHNYYCTPVFIPVISLLKITLIQNNQQGPTLTCIINKYLQNYYYYYAYVVQLTVLRIYKSKLIYTYYHNILLAIVIIFYKILS